jgi:DNA-binding transcriptional LysR family regulator
MELRHLHYFKVLAEELHFRKASEKLHIAQPALSRQIKELESELDVKLFDRNRRKVLLTPAGKYLYTKTNSWFKQIEEAKREAKKIQNMEVGNIRIGYVASAMHSVLPSFLVKIKKQHPQLQLSLAEMTTNDQLESIHNGSLEFGFVRCPIDDTLVSQKTVFKENFALVLPAKHPLANKKITTLSVLKNESFIFFPRHYNPGYYDKTISMCYQAGFSPNIQYEGVGSYTLLQMVASGLGVTILPFSIAKAFDERVKCAELKFIKEKPELAIIYDGKRLSPALQKLL